jgi:monofunctional biosynthetic peptidoglycan transglycosylase
VNQVGDEFGELVDRRLEQALSKDRIFSLYLNLIELGPGIFGVEAAARAHFGKPVTGLSLGEIVRLVAVIPRPLTASPVVPSRWVSWRARWTLDLLAGYGYISPGERDAEKRTLGLPAKR